MVGNRLKHIRKEKGLSQKELASLIDSSQGYICDIEKGKKMPGSEFLISLKRFFGISLDWFLTGEGEPRPKTTYPCEPMSGGMVTERKQDYFDPTVKGIMDAVAGLDEQGKKDVLKYAEEKKFVVECLKERQANKKAG